LRALADGGGVSRLRLEARSFGRPSAAPTVGWLILAAFAPGPGTRTADSQELITYQLRYGEPGASGIEIRMTLPQNHAGPRLLVMPRAIPMGYGEQPFDRFVEDVRAFRSDANPVPVERVEGPRWRIGGPDDTVRRIEYRVDLARMEQEILSASDSSKVRPGYVGLLGYSVFAFLEGQEETPLLLEVSAPADWAAFLTLAPAQPPARGTAQARAANFYALADSQIVLGPAAAVERVTATVPLFVVIYAEGEVDRAAVARLGLEALERLAAYFGVPPFPHYTIHQEYLKPLSPAHRYGFSMEHLDSGTFYLQAGEGIGSGSPESLRARTRYNFAHHIAHSWIPKRSYGKGYYPFTWELAPVLDTIWFSEGFAQYAALEAIAAGMPQPQAGDYRERMLEARFRANLAEAPAFIKKMGLVELSRVASTRYSEDFRTGRNVFSRGGLMAAEIDEHIRKASGGEKSLKDALRHLVDWSLRTRRPFEIAELPVLFSMATGVDTRAIMERWLKPLEE
jgi:predicted metalloprotease with PDZ domain